MGYDRWYLHVDADERLVFDGAPRPAGRAAASPTLIAFAEARGLRRLRGMLVDLYPPGPLLARRPRTAGGSEARVRLFDGDGYDEALCLERISRKGGPRRRASSAFDPELTKYPLFRIRAGEVASSPHHLHPYRENYRSDCFLGLLHDKFGAGFRAKAERAAAEGNYWQRQPRVPPLRSRSSPATPASRSTYPGSRRYRAPGRPRRRRADRADPLAARAGRAWLARRRAPRWSGRRRGGDGRR